MGRKKKEAPANTKKEVISRNERENRKNKIVNKCRSVKLRKIHFLPEIQQFLAQKWCISGN